MGLCVQRQTVTVLQGTTGYSGAVNGILREIRYLQHGSNPYSAATVTITTEQTGLTLLGTIDVALASATYALQADKSLNTSGASMLYAAGGQTVMSQLAIANERIKIQVDGGVDGTTGQWLLIVEGVFQGPASG